MDGVSSSSVVTVHITGCCHKKMPWCWTYSTKGNSISCKCLWKRSIKDQSNKIPFTEERRALMVAAVASNEKEYEKRLGYLQLRISEMKIPEAKRG